MASFGMISILPETSPHAYLVVGTHWALRLVLFLLCFQFRSYFFTRDQRQEYDDWIVANSKEIFATHGIAVYLFLYFFQGILAPESQPTRATKDWIRIILHCTSIPFAFLLWELGRVYGRDIKSIIYGRDFSSILLINLHHLGVFLALPYHISEDPMVATKTTRAFASLWMVHVFPLGFSKLFSILIEKGASEATVKTAFGRMKDLYSLVTVFFLHDYFCGESQPGFGWNYQTVCMVTMWTGRYGYNCNMNRVGFFRRIEVPGSIVVVLSSLFFQGNLYRGIAATVCVYALELLAESTLKDNRPGKWDPEHPSIARVLREFELEFLASKTSLDDCEMNEIPGNQELLYLWKINKVELQEKYPMAKAIIENNVKDLEAIILKGGDSDAASIYQPMKELRNYTPGEMAVALDRLRCVLVLITKAGLDPWEGSHCEGNSIWVLAKKFGIVPLLELRDRLEPAALDAYPPISSSILDRADKNIRQFFRQ